MQILKWTWVLIRLLRQYIRVAELVRRANDRRVVITRARWYGSQIQDEELRQLFLNYIATLERIYVADPEPPTSNDPLIPT